MRGYFGLGQLSASEKQDILNQHKSLYNGYQTMQPQVSNTQPLYVFDAAGDKDGMVVNNKGEVKKYTNMGINEQAEKNEVCDECGAMIMDGVCSECNYGHMEESEMEEGNMCEQCGGTMKEDVCEQCGSGRMEEETGHLDDIYKVRDLNLKKGDFDYVEGGGNDYGTFEGMHKNLYKEDDGDDFVNYDDNMKDDYRDLSMYNPYYNDDDFEDYESSYTQDGVDDPDNEDDGFEDLELDEISEQGGNVDDMDDDEIPSFDSNGEFKGMVKSNWDYMEDDDDFEDLNITEIEVDKLSKGSRYKYRPTYRDDYEDDIEFMDKIDYKDNSNPHFMFKGTKSNYLFPDRDVEDYISDLDEQEGNVDDMDGDEIPSFDSNGEFKGMVKSNYDNMDDDIEDDISSLDEQGGNVDDMDDDDVEPAYDFESNGPIGVYPVNEDDMYGYEPEKTYEEMESAWADDEIEEEMDEQDVSGAQGIYGGMKKAYDFDSDGPGKAGPYQEFSYESELEEYDSEDDFGFETHSGDFGGDDSEEDFGFTTHGGDFEGDDSEEDEWKEIDVDIKESFITQKNKISEMFNRINKFN